MCGWTTRWILGQQRGALGWPLMSLLMERSASSRSKLPIHTYNSDGTGLEGGSLSGGGFVNMGCFAVSCLFVMLNHGP